MPDDPYPNTVNMPGVIQQSLGYDAMPTPTLRMMQHPETKEMILQQLWVSSGGSRRWAEVVLVDYTDGRHRNGYDF